MNEGGICFGYFFRITTMVAIESAKAMPTKLETRVISPLASSRCTMPSIAFGRLNMLYSVMREVGSKMTVVDESMAIRTIVKPC